MWNMVKPYTHFMPIQIILPLLRRYLNVKTFSKLFHLNSYMVINSTEVRNHVN